MLQSPNQNILSIKNSKEFQGYLEIARSHFVTFFDSKEQFDRLSSMVENQVFNYAFLCQMLSEDITKSLIFPLLETFEAAYKTDRNKAIDIMTRASIDFDTSAVKNAHLNSEYEEVSRSRSQMLPRDRAIRLMNNIEGLIEGVLKKRFWSLPACNDIANKLTDRPERWQHQQLGNIVKAVQSLPILAGEALAGDPIKEISLNQLRNIAAHKDFEIKEEKIVLRTSKLSRTENIDTLFKVLDDLHIRLAIITIVLRLTLIRHLEEIIKAGYAPGAYLPENSTTTIASQLAEKGINLQKIDYKDGIISVHCHIQEITLNPITALNICLGKIILINNVYWGTIQESPDDVFKIIMTKLKETATLTISRKDWLNTIQNKLDYPAVIQYSMENETLLAIYDPENQKWRGKLGIAGLWNSMIKTFFILIGVRPKILRYWESAQTEDLEALPKTG